MKFQILRRTWILLTVILIVGLSIFLLSHSPGKVQAGVTADPSSVTLVGSLQSELDCAGDWDPSCAATHLVDQGNGVWRGEFNVPAGSWEYKIALNDSWDENYGGDFQPNGPNISLNLISDTIVRFYYDHKTHFIADNAQNLIYTIPGSFNSELGCPGDWQPGCLITFMSDIEKDGFYTFTTDSIPAGSYEFKVAVNESWDVSYGQDGGPSNISFTVPGAGYIVTFTFDSLNNIPGVSMVSTGPQPDNNVEWDGLRHDSRDLLYRTPGGAVPAGTPVELRFRTYHNDVTGVKARVYDLDTGSQVLLPMQLAASAVDCYQEGLSAACDFWEVTLDNPTPATLWYRFLVTDGTDTDYYADNTPALDGGLGNTSDDVIDQSYALTVYDPSFVVPAWADEAIIYQIFPDRFRDGRKNNNPETGDIRYDDPVLALPWGTLPEGYCRNYADGSTNCPWRFDDTPPEWSLTKESPRGRDYMGGDLKGVDQYLDYLMSLGVNTLYFNPIFDAGSNHAYDTQDYYKIDPYFGTQKDWENLVKHAENRGMRIILDGVFNHLSSDSPFFDRYHHYNTQGACESIKSPYRDWFYFHDVTPGTGPCVGSDGTPLAATYDGWYGFDTIPVINKSLPEVQRYFLTKPNSVTRYWLDQGASGWRMDVMGDASFPAGYWETFRGVVKETQADALIISETWQKDSTLLRMLRGDRADSTMNYRLRDAVIGLLTPGNFDSKGFADSGRQILPSEFASRLESIQEDYPQAAYYSLMNLLDSHDTERLLWAMTPGIETTAEKELNLENLAAGKQRQKMASLIQFTMPGAPTVFYGDEVAITGDDDPDDRRTYPWANLKGNPDQDMFAHYQALAAFRQQYPVLVDGDFQVLLADDTAEVVAYGRKNLSQAAIVVINRSAAEQAVTIPVADYLPDGVMFQQIYAAGSGGSTSIAVIGGVLPATIGANSALVFVTGLIDLEAPPAPLNLVAEEGNAQVSLSWEVVPGASAYTLYRSPVSGGGWVAVGQDLTGNAFLDTELVNGMTYYYVVTATDSVGNESIYSNEVVALPHYTIDWANLQWPPTITHAIGPVDWTSDVYGQVWINGATYLSGATPSLIAQLGFGPVGSNPAGNPDWTWEGATFNVDAGNNDEFKARMLPTMLGEYDYLYRYSTTNGRDWLYADLNGPIPDGSLPPNPGKLTVFSTGDLTAPEAPTGLIVTSASPTAITLGWDAHPDTDGDLAGFEIYRDGSLLATIIGPSLVSYTDSMVTENMSYSYYIQAIDESYNRSAPSNAVTAVAAPRTVTLIFNVTVPDTTDATGMMVYIAGFLDRLDGDLPQWDPAGVVLTWVDATHWTITLTGQESVQIEYKYTLGSWDYVEKDDVCGEIANRQLTLSYGTDGIMMINDIVENWRNISPCGN